MFLENTICEKTFSVSSTSNSLTFDASFSLPADDTLCELGKSRSLRAQKTRPGGYKSAVCMFASSVFLVAKNFPGNEHDKEGIKKPSGNREDEVLTHCMSSEEPSPHFHCLVRCVTTEYPSRPPLSFASQSHKAALRISRTEPNDRRDTISSEYTKETINFDARRLKSASMRHLESQM